MDNYSHYIRNLISKLTSQIEHVRSDIPFSDLSQRKQPLEPLTHSTNSQYTSVVFSDCQDVVPAAFLGHLRRTRHSHKIPSQNGLFSLAYLDIHCLGQFGNNNIDSAHGLMHDNTTIIKLKHTITG